MHMPSVCTHLYADAPPHTHVPINPRLSRTQLQGLDKQAAGRGRQDRTEALGHTGCHHSQGSVVAPPHLSLSGKLQPSSKAPGLIEPGPQEKLSHLNKLIRDVTDICKTTPAVRSRGYSASLTARKAGCPARFMRGQPPHPSVPAEAALLTHMD